MKKYISIIIAAIMIFSTISVFAAQKTKIEDLELNIPDNFSILDKFDEGIFYINNKHEYETMYIFHLENKYYKNMDEATDLWAENVIENMASDELIIDSFSVIGHTVLGKGKSQVESKVVYNKNGVYFLEVLTKFKAHFSDGTQKDVYGILYATIHNNKEYLIYNNGIANDNDCISFIEMIEEISFEEENQAPAQDTSVIKITVDGERVYPDSDPVIVNDRTLCPIRAVAEKLGYKVDWDGDTRTVTIKNDEREIQITVGGDKITGYRNAKDPIGLPIQRSIDVILDVPAQIINDRTYLPLRAVSEALRCLVDWDGATRTVKIETGQYGEKVYKDAFIDKYHQPSCQMLQVQAANGCTLETEFLNELILSGYEPCSICN